MKFHQKSIKIVSSIVTISLIAVFLFAAGGVSNGFAQGEESIRDSRNRYSGLAMSPGLIGKFVGSCYTPATPSLVEPSNDATLDDTTPYFAWNAATDASVYEFILDNDSDFSSSLVDSTSLAATNYTPGESLGAGDYYWKVRGRYTGSGCNTNGGWSETRTFTVAPPVAADDTYQTAPDVALTKDAPGVLENDSDPLGHDLSAVKVSDPAHGTVILNADGSFTYTPEVNFIGSDSFTYKANNGSVDSNTATATINILAANWPVKLKPLDGAAIKSGVTKVKMSWKLPAGSKAKDIRNYEVQLADDAAFTNIVASKTLKATNWTYTKLLPNTTYYWQVRALFKDGTTGNWSTANAATSFNTQLTKGPTLKAPGNNSKQIKDTMKLIWKRPTGCPSTTMYTLLISTDPTFPAGDSIVVDRSGLLTTSYTVRGEELAVSIVPGSTTYYWRVMAFDSSGFREYSNWSSAHSFKR
jgi:hypothetical protein